MPIYVRCVNCKSDQSIKNRVCSKCGTPLPKNKSYIVKVSYNGKMVTQTVSDLSTARKIEVKIKSELINGDYYNRRKAAKENVKYKAFIKDKYIPYAKDKKSLSTEILLLNKWILPILGDKSLSSISPFDIEKVKKDVLEAGKAPRTAKYVLSIIQHTINKAIEFGIYTKTNPVALIRKPKVNNKRTRFLSPKEVDDLLAEIKKRSYKTYEICLISLYTGIRAGEIFNLKFGDVDLENGIIHIKNPKNGEDRVAYITYEIRFIFESKNGEPDEYVFKDAKGNRIDKVSKTFSRAVNALGLNKGITDRKDKVVFHTLRHTFASWLAINGTPIYTIKELMGHKTLAMTERYSHLAPDSKRNAVAKLSGIMRSSKVVRFST